MLRSLYSAVSGVKAHQTYLDVTGNNIANVNTVGFKRDVIQFRDMIYQTIKGASAPNSAIPIGGVNPAQVGLGVGVGSIETVHTQGSLQSTGNPTDMAIQGSGYFVVKNGQQQYYTRAGNFAMDRDGNLVMSGNGYLVQGYAYKDQVDPATGNTIRVRDAALSNINIPIGQKIPAKETTIAAFRCNLCSTTKPAIAGLDSIPGGENKVLRPHMYDAYGATAATYVGDTASRTAMTTGVNGDTFYDTTTNKLYRWDNAQTTNKWVEVRDGNSYEAFYGKNAIATTEDDYYASVFATTNDAFAATDATYDGMIAKRAKVDAVGNDTPELDADDEWTVDLMQAGQTYLDTSTGRIYKMNATGDAWDTVGYVPADTGVTTSTANPPVTTYAAGTVYVDANGALYVPDQKAEGNDPKFIAATNTTIMDATTHQLMTWNSTSKSWTAVNDSLGLSPDDSEADLEAVGRKPAVTNQATIEAFGESMIKSHDWSDKATVYDSLGNPYTMEVVFRKVLERPANPTAEPPTSAESEWDWYAYYVDAEGKQIKPYGQGAGTLVFGDDGLLKRTYYYEPTPTATPDPNGTATTQPVYDWAVVEKITDPDDTRSVTDAALSTGKIVADFNLVAAEGSVTGTPPDDLTYASNMITLDFLGNDISKALGVEKGAIDGTTQYGSPSTNKVYYQDGYAMGEMNDWTVGQDGTITGIYSNGQLLAISTVALAMFANPQGLNKVGETCFSESSNSGMAQVGIPGSGGSGTIKGSTIEMSNTDLSEEFVNLIRAQRGFQANTRVVTTSDQVLEELINMKR